LTIESRSAGPNVWVFRWRETQPDGSRKRRKTVVGSVEQYASEAAARRAVDALRVSINQADPGLGNGTMTIGAVAAHYREVELRQEHETKAFSTKECYRTMLNTWILPRWGSYQLREVRTVAIEEWLGRIPRSRSTRAKIRGVMSVLFNHARRWEWFDKNPVTMVRQSAKRERIPTVLEMEEIRALLAELKPLLYTLVMVAATTGLRISELLALKWQDVDFENLSLSVTKSIWRNVVGQCKTEASRKPVPLDSFMAEALWRWKQTTAFNRPEHWVFASPYHGGRQPYGPKNLLERHIWPAALRAGIQKRIGWHTFRHTFGTQLKANGEDVKTVQELLRHANPRVTLESYAQAVTAAKRQAQRRVVEMINGGCSGREERRSA